MHYDKGMGSKGPAFGGVQGRSPGGVRGEAPSGYGAKRSPSGGAGTSNAFTTPHSAT